MKAHSYLEKYRGTNCSRRQPHLPKRPRGFGKAALKPQSKPFFSEPPLSGGLDLDSRSSGCARLGGGVGPPLGVVVEEVAVLVIFLMDPELGVAAVPMQRTTQFYYWGLDGNHCFSITTWSHKKT